MTLKFDTLLLAAFLSTTAMTATPVLAAPEGADDAQGGAGGLEDIVVTARRKSESLQDVPVAVTAISRIELQNNLATDLNKIAELAPQVMIGRVSSGTGAVLTIRGISSLAVDSGLDQSVAVAIDGVPLSRGRITGATLFDMEQVEVLKGPQALFFGKNSPAGVISMRTANPTDSLEGYARAGYEFEAKERYVEGAVSGPLSGNLSARLAVRAGWMDGWIRNVAKPVESPFNPGVTMPGPVNGRTTPSGHDYVGRFSLQWEPGDDFNIGLKVTVNEQKQNSGAAYSETYCASPTAVPTTGGVAVPYGDCRKNRVKADSALPPEFAGNYPYANGGVPYMDSTFLFSVFNIDKRLGDVDLTATTGYYYQNLSDSYNADFTPFTRIYNAEHERYELLTQELRLNTAFDGPLNFMGGVYFETAKRDWANLPNLFNIYNPVEQAYYTNQHRSHSRNKGFSAFGQVRWNIVPTLELAAGLRYSKDTKRSTFVNVVNNPASPVAAGLRPEGLPLKARYSGDNVSPDVTLTWKPDPDQTIYAGYKTGYKSGGISNGALLQATATAQSLTFGEEKVRGFEVGYKADLLNNRLRVDLTAYSYKYRGLQVSFFDSTLFLFRVGNAAAARTEGVEGSFKWLATDALTLNGSVGYNRARFLKFAGGQCYSGQTVALGCVGGLQDLSGTAPNRAPKVTFTVGGDYRAELGSDWVADLSVDGSYSDSYQTAADNAPGAIQPSFWRLNAALHLSPADERFRLSLIGRNLTNTYYLISSSVQPSAGNPNQFLGFFNRPREVALQAQVRF